MSIAVILAACGTTATTTTASSEPPTTAETTTTTTSAPTVDTDRVFFLQDSGGNRVRQGPFLISVSRDLNGATPKEVVEALVAGPTPDETEAGISSGIPDVTVRSVDISDGVAIVDFDRLFEAGGGTFLMTSRLAQLTFTLTAIDGVEGVQLLLGGEPVEVFSGEGIIIDNPMTRDGFEDLLPGILVETPAWGSTVSTDFVIEGTAAVFEAVFLFDVSQGGSVVLGEQIGMTDNGVGWGTFSEEVFLSSDLEGDIDLRVWEYSAEDGSVQAERVIRLTLGE